MDEGEGKMKHEQLMDEIRETNLAYLLLAQQMIRLDRATAMFRLGISDDVAQILEQLSAGQILKMAASNMLLCRFRFDDRLILGLLTDHGKSKPMAQSHAAVLMAGQPAAGLA
jgi:flagellar transcriptional activator FlhD